MAWEDFFNHKCDIYHISKSTGDMGYGLQDKNLFSYSSNPALEAIPCHFHLKTGQQQVVQSSPMTLYTARLKISLPAGTDIRINDKVVDRGTGYAYRAELPMLVHNNHHIIVWLNREGVSQEAI